MRTRVAVLVLWVAAFVAGCAIDESFESIEQAAIYPAPENLRVVSLSANALTVTWDPVPGVTKYNQERQALDPLSGTSGGSLPTGVVSHTFANLNRDTLYRFRIYPQDPNNGEPGIPAELVLTTPSDLVAPTLTATTSSTSRIELAWSATPMATKYYVFQATAGGSFSYVTSSTGTQYSSTNLAPDTEYSYKVQAADATSVSLDSNIATATTTLEPPGPTEFGAPTNVRATPVLSTRIQVDWTAVDGAAKYYVFQAEAAGPMTYVASVLTNSYTARGLVPNTTYSYVIQAVTAWNAESALSSPPASAKTFLAPPTVTATALSSSRIEVDWTASPDAVKYYVFQDGAYAGTVFSTTFTAANLVSGTTYSFVVQAVDANDNPSSNSAPSSATTFGGSVGVPAPEVTATAVSSSRIEVTWPAVTGAAKYYVFQDGAYVGTASTNAWTATGLTTNTSYTFVVQSVNVVNITSPDSAPASATTLADGPAVLAPEDVEATAISSSQIFVSWSEVTGATKYYVFQSQGAGPLTYVTTVSAPSTNLVVSGLDAGTEYSYVVEAVDANEERSSGSAPATATTFE